MITDNIIKNICYTFKAFIIIKPKANTTVSIKKGYTPFINLNNISQLSRVLSIENLGETELIKFKNNTGYVIMTLKFKYKPEYISKGEIFILRDHNINAFGIILETIEMENDVNAKADYIKKKNRHKNKNKNK